MKNKRIAITMLEITNWITTGWCNRKLLLFLKEVTIRVNMYQSKQLQMSTLYLIILIWIYRNLRNLLVELRRKKLPQGNVQIQLIRYSNERGKLVVKIENTHRQLNQHRI